MKIFYDLADDEKKCTEAIRLLVNELKSSESDSSLTYCWKRLVKGMPSNRKNARLGFAVALSEVLQCFPMLSSEEVYGVCKETNLPSGHISSKETRDLYTGFSFCVSSLHKSGRLVNHEFCLQVLKDFIPIVFKENLTIKDVLFRVLIDILDDIESNNLTDIVKLFDEELKKGWKECTPERLALVSYFEKKDGSLVSRILKNHWNYSHIHHPQNYEKIALVLQSIFCEEYLKPQLTVILDCCTSSSFFKSKKAYKNFFNVLESGENKNTVVLIMAHFISAINESKLETFVSKLASEFLKKCYLSSPKCVHHLTKCLIERVAQIKTSEVKLLLVKSMLLYCPSRNSCLFRVLDSHFNNVAPEENEQYISLLQNSIIEPTETEKIKIYTEFRNDCLSWALQVTKTSASKEVFELTKFLFIYSYFEVKGECKEFPQVKIPNPPLSLETISFFKTKFSSCLKVLTTNSANKTSKQKGLAEDGRYWVYHLMSCSLLLVTNEKFPMICDVTMYSEWTNLWSIIDEIEAKPLDSRSCEDWAFELLFLHCGILFFDEQELIKVILNDAHQCYGKHKNDNSNDWKVVFIDLLISILSYESLMLRNMACECFHLICKDINKEVVNIIMSALESSDKEEIEMESEVSSESDCSEQSMSDNDDSSENILEGTVINDENNDQGAIDLAESDDSIEEFDDDNDGLDDVNLSDANEEDLDKEDKALGLAMKGFLDSKKEQKENKKEKALKKVKMIHFKVKILDFIEIIVKDVGFSVATMDIIPGLLKLVASSTVTSGPVYNKVLCIFKNFLSLKPEKVNVKLDEDIKPDIEKIQEIIRKSSNKKAQSLAIQTLFLLCKVHLNNCKGKQNKIRSTNDAQLRSGDQVYSVFNTILQDFIINKNSKISKEILFQAIERFPIIRPNLVHDVTTYIDRDLTIYARMQGISLLQRVLSFSDRECHDWQNIILLSVKNLLNDLIKNNKSPHHIRECLKLCIKLHSNISKLELKVNTFDGDMMHIIENIAISELSIKHPDIASLSRKVVSIFDN